MQRCVNILGRLLKKQCVTVTIRNRVNIQCVSVRCLSQIDDNVQNKSKIKTNFRRKVSDVNDLFNYIKEGNLFYLKLLNNVFPTIDFNSLKSEEAILLLKCCGSSVADSSRGNRNKVCQEIFNNLKRNDKLELNIFNTYLKTCNENCIPVDYKEFLSTIKCEPDTKTYKLLLENVCQIGNIHDGLMILEIMKDKNTSVDIDIFNNLILAHAIDGGLKSAEAVLKTMRTAHIPETNDTKMAIFKGIIKKKDFEEFKKAVQEYSFALSQENLLVLLEELGLVGNQSWLSEINDFCKNIHITREFQAQIEFLCIHLIHMGQPVSAMEIFEEFVTPVPDILYGYTLLKEMLHCNIDITMIISFAQNIKDKGLNDLALENLTELALRFGYVDQAWILLGTLDTARPHYFWPLLTHEGKNNGENGIFSVLKKLKDFNVKPDSDTLENFVFPYCDSSNLKLLVLKLQEEGLTVTEIVSPLITYLLQRKKSKQASNICNLYNVKIVGDRLFQHLSVCWTFTKDTNSIVSLLQRYCESNRTDEDFVGKFLVDSCKIINTEDDYRQFLTLVKVLGNRRLRINSHSADALQEIYENCRNEKLKLEIRLIINSLLDFTLKPSEDTAIPSTRNMNINDLECHLIELQEKNMETRGIIRKLILLHASQGNFNRVQELRHTFLELGYAESAGMKSSLMHSYTLGGYLDEALGLYLELKQSPVEFGLDSFKVIDLAKVLIENDRFEEGFELLEKEFEKISHFAGNTASIQRNCTNLLSSCKTEEEVNTVFELLLKRGACKPTNVILGPLVRVHLKSGDLTKAVEVYTKLSTDYKCTPLQFEVMCAVLKTENTELLQKVLQATERVHGSGPAQVGLIASLAEMKQEKPLWKVLSRINIPIKALLEKRCNRWVQERKKEPLVCLANASKRLPEEIINTDMIYRCIFDIYSINHDYAGALNFYESISEDFPNKLRLEKYLKTVFVKCNVSPSENLKLKN